MSWGLKKVLEMTAKVKKKEKKKVHNSPKYCICNITK